MQLRTNEPVGNSGFSKMDPVIERNTPATFTYPIWSILADFKMLFCFFTGRMGAELEFAGLGNAQQKNEEDIPESTNSNES